MVCLTNIGLLIVFLAHSQRATKETKSELNRGYCNVDHPPLVKT